MLNNCKDKGRKGLHFSQQKEKNRNYRQRGGRDKEQAMFFYTARRCRFVLFLRGSF